MFEFIVSDLDPGFVLPRIQGGANDEARLRGCTCDQIHNDLVAGERTPAPVLGDETEQPMFDLVPLAGARRKVTHPQGDSKLVRQELQRLLPKPITTAVAATSVRRKAPRVN